MSSLILLLLLLTFGQGRGLSLMSPAPLALYKQALAARPLITNMVTAGSLSVLSDSITQRAEKDGLSSTSSSMGPYNYYRSATMFVYGFLIGGGFVSLWFKILNRWIPTNASSSLLLVVKKVFVNQVIMSPILNSMFFTWVGLTRGGLDTTMKDKRELIVNKITNDLVPTMKRSCFYWGIVNIANFWVVSQRYQLLFTNVGFVLWFAYLSFVGYKDQKSHNNKD